MGKEQHDVPEIRSNSEKDTDDKSSKLRSKDLKKKRVRSNVTHMSSEINYIPAINNNNEISNVVPMYILSNEMDNETTPPKRSNKRKRSPYQIFESERKQQLQKDKSGPKKVSTIVRLLKAEWKKMSGD